MHKTLRLAASFSIAFLAAACVAETSEDPGAPDELEALDTDSELAATTYGDKSGIAMSGWYNSLTEEERGKWLDRARDAGVHWVRFGLEWSSIEKNKGELNWANFDKKIEETRARGLRVLALVAYTPTWARPADCKNDHTCAPANVQDYANFFRQAVQRYGGKGVGAFEIWNEPNMNMFWKPRPNPVKYTAMVKAAYAAAKPYRNGATILAGVLSPAPDDANGNRINPVTFLDAMYDNGVAGQFDALSIHPYPGTLSPEVDKPWSMFTNKAPALHQIMVDHGNGGKKIWATESGYSTCPDSPDHCVTESVQASLTPKLFQEWYKKPYGGPLFLFTMSDWNTDPTSRDNNLGIYRRNETKKPAVATLKAQMQKSL